MKVNITFDYDIENILGDSIDNIDILVSKKEFNSKLREVFTEFIELEIEGVFQTGEVPDIIMGKLHQLNIVND
ncbi:MAG: hypothetical protein ACRC18_06940 [Cetobacterium sp.]